jgi:endonuclease/exonuclease/phosphatase (EEP) superfamily protein YafD
MVSTGGFVRALRGIVAGVVVLFGIATLLGLLDRMSWVFELADVFRLQYLVVLVAAALAALALRRPRLAALAAAFAAVNIAILGISFIPAATAASGTPHGSLRLVVTNVEVGNKDFAAVERLVAKTRPDVLGITELTPAMARHLEQALPGYGTRIVAARDDAYGIGVFSRVPLRSGRIAHFPTDGGPPTVVARARVGGAPVTLVVTHVHTPFAGSIHARHLEALAAARRGLGERVAVCGDFNTPPWSGPLRQFASDSGYRDLYGGRAWAGYSWPTWNALLRIPIDNCFVSSKVVVRSYHDGPDVGSDHKPLVVDLAAVTE